MEKLRKRFNDAMNEDESDNPDLFLSMVSSILWGAQRSKPEVLFDVTTLATRCKIGSTEDIIDVEQVLKYINSCKADGIKLKINGNISISVFVDSSGGIDSESKAKGGYVISLGDKGFGGPIESRSYTSKFNGRSMVEYELFAFHEMLPGPLFVKELLEELGFNQLPILVFEDNKALIDLLRRGKISSGVIRHIHSKYYYGKDLIIRKIIELRHCPTLLMIADIFTKDLDFPTFNRLCKRLRNGNDQDPKLSDEIYQKLYENSNYEVYLDKDEQKAVEVLSLIIETLLQS